MEIIISADLDLHAGDLVYCGFEKLSNAETIVESDKRDSGIYMIADLCHHGTKTNSFTALHLVRDSYGVKDYSIGTQSLSSSNADIVMDSNFLPFIK